MMLFLAGYSFGLGFSLVAAGMAFKDTVPKVIGAGAMILGLAVLACAL